MKKFFQCYVLENPGEVKKLLLGFPFFVGSSFIIFSSSKAGWFFKILGTLAFIMGLFSFFVSLVGLSTLVFIRPKFKRNILPALVEELNLQGNEQILDLGSDQGLLPLLLSQKLTSGKVTTLYPQLKKYKKVFQSVKKKIKRKELEEKIEARSCDMSNLPYPDDHFDLVCSTLFFHSLSHGQDLILQEILRVLKPNAQFIFFDIRSVALINDLQKQKVDLLVKNCAYFPGGRHIFGHNKLMSNDGLINEHQTQENLEEVKPPWVVHPEIGPCDGYWRQPGEYWFYHIWHPYWISLSEDEQKKYLEKYKVPDDWWAFYFDPKHQIWLDENIPKGSAISHIVRM